MYNSIDQVQKKVWYNGVKIMIDISHTHKHKKQHIRICMQTATPKCLCAAKGKVHDHEGCLATVVSCHPVRNVHAVASMSSLSLCPVTKGI